MAGTGWILDWCTILAEFAIGTRSPGCLENVFLIFETFHCNYKGGYQAKKRLGSTTFPFIKNSEKDILNSPLIFKMQFNSCNKWPEDGGRNLYFSVFLILSYLVCTVQRILILFRRKQRTSRMGRIFW